MCIKPIQIAVAEGVKWIPLYFTYAYRCGYMFE